MVKPRTLRLGLRGLLVGLMSFLIGLEETQAYIEAPHSLGQVINLSTNILVCRVEKVDKEKNLIIYRKIRDLKGIHNEQVIKHNIGKAGFHPREWQYPMEWAEVGKTAVFFHNGGAGEMCIGTYWYQMNAGGEWWTMTHGEPFLLRSFAGNVDKLINGVVDILAGKEVVLPCMVNSIEDLHLRRGKIMRCRCSLKLNDYNPKRDFVAWGGEDFRRVSGMPGFTHMSGLPRVDPEAQGISSVDLDGDGKPDLCLVGASKVALLQNGGEALTEITLPNGSGCRAAVWADYNGDGLVDLLLATTSGPRLYTNLGKGQFRDDSHLLPGERGYNLTSAAWIDADSDGRPDLLLGNGYHGLRLLRNEGAIAAQEPLVLGDWSYLGPFSNKDGKGFATAYPPEKGIDLKGKYPGRNGKEIAWKPGNFKDGEINNLALFEAQDNNDSVIYLHREITCRDAMELPVSLGSDDSLKVWLNGKEILSEGSQRSCSPDQNRLTLRLNAGKNQLLLKVCQYSGEWAYYFHAEGTVPRAITWKFEDVSDNWGLGPEGISGRRKGDSLVVADVNGDGKLDFLYGSGSGTLVLNAGSRFVEATDSGLAYRPGKIGPIFGDFLNDGKMHLFVPQSDGCKLYRNDGKGKFTDCTAQSRLDQFKGNATSAAWGDVDNDGQLDLVIGCLKEPNRYFRNIGDGIFEDATAKIGLNQKVFNTQAVCLVDINNDGVLDMVFNNEGQEPVVLLGNPEAVAKNSPVLLKIDGPGGVVGSRFRLLDPKGNLLGSGQVSGGDGRGGQASPLARFAVQPGTYRVEVQYSSGIRRGKEIQVSASPFRDQIDARTPQLD